MVARNQWTFDQFKDNASAYPVEVRRDVQQYLADRGFPKVANLSGGILRWADEIDPALQRY